MAKAKPEPLRADATDAEFAAAMDRHRNLVFPLRRVKPLAGSAAEAAKDSSNEEPKR